MRTPTRMIQARGALAAAALTLGCGDAAPGGGGATPDGGAPPPVIGSGGGFQVGTHGFSFQNYTNQGRTNLTAAEVRRMYGDRVCATLEGSTCTLTPQAEQWMTQINAAMNGGHCEGMAVAAQMFHAGRRDPMDFGAATVNALTLDGNEALQREIAYWFALQAVAPTSRSRLAMSPSRVVSTLRASFLPGSNQAYTIAFFKPGFKAGHAVTPVSIRDGEGGRAEVVIYDNNFPDAERAIAVDTGAETWSYQAAANPDQPASLYEGTAETGTLMLVPLAQRLATHDCAFCGDYRPPAAAPDAPDPAMPMPAAVPSSEEPREVQTSGAGDTRVQTPMGTVGSVGGAMMNTLPGATVTPITSAEPWLVENEPVYRVPSGLPLRISVDGTSMSAASPTDLTVMGQGYSLSVRHIMLDPGQNDTVTVAPVGAAMRYVTTQSESADVVVGAQFEGADWLFTVRTHGGAGGESITVELDPARGVLEFGFDGVADGMNTFDLEVERIDAQGVSEFLHTGSAGENGADLVLHYGTWGGDGTAMQLGVDATGDGTEDMMMPLNDM